MCYASFLLHGVDSIDYDVAEKIYTDFSLYKIK